MNARRTILLAGLAVSLGLVLAGGSGGATQSAVGFAQAVYVDQQLAGGEPEVIADTLHGKLVYTAHEGTTHLRTGLPLFAAVSRPMKLTLVDAQTFPSGVVAHVYQPAETTTMSWGGT